MEKAMCMKKSKKGYMGELGKKGKREMLQLFYHLKKAFKRVDFQNIQEVQQGLLLNNHVYDIFGLCAYFSFRSKKKYLDMSLRAKTTCYLKVLTIY